MPRLAKDDRMGAKADLTEALRRFLLLPKASEEFGPVVRIRKALEAL